MVMSMTGFARVSSETPWGLATWELKSVNHRYLEMGFRLPETLRLFETKWRQCIQRRLHRGKVECLLRFMPSDDANMDFKLNRALITQLAHAGEAVGDVFGQKPSVSVMNVLAYPGVVQVDMADTDELVKALAECLDQALTQLADMRETEGQTLTAFLTERVQQMQQLVAQVEARMPEALVLMREKLDAKFADLQVECDKERFEQEVVWLMQKADVAEELHRLSAHLNEVLAVLKKPGAIGRRLDFIMQELNREANTLASKSIDLAVTNVSVDLKVLIEQMREQVQNIE